MVAEIADFVLQNANAPGTTASVQLLTTPTGRRGWLSAFSSGAAVRYVMDDGTQAEGGRGTLAAGSPDTLSRDTVRWNTAGTTSRLDFTGAVRVYCALAAEDMVYLDSAGQVGPLALKGITDGSSAASGIIGEMISASVARASAVTLTTSSPANVTSILLPAGDWEVEGTIGFANAATGVSYYFAGVSTASATLPTSDNGGLFCLPGSFGAGYDASFPTGRIPINSSGSTRVYLVGEANFTSGTMGGFGRIWARRVG